MAGKHMLPDHDRTTVMVLELAPIEPIDFRCCHATLAIWSQFEQHAASVVSIAGEHQVITNTGSRNVGSPIGDIVIAPEKATVVAGDADQAATDHLDILANAGTARDDDRREAGTIGSGRTKFRYGRFPDRLASQFVERHDHGLWTAGRADESIPVHQR